MSIELRFVTIITDDGITIFHKSFVEDDIDEYLFSGFSSAMITFSKELGDSLQQIKMENQTLVYHDMGEAVLILSVINGYDENELITNLYLLRNSEILNMIIEGSRMGIVQGINEQFENEIMDIFDISVERLEDENVEEEEGDEKDMFMEALEELGTMDL